MIRLRADSDRLRRMLRQREIDAVFRRAPPGTFDEALELGAGDGFQSRFLAVYARRVVCTDMNADRLRGEAHPSITYEVCDTEELPYETGRFDLIYSSNLLEHLQNPARALSEMHRVLKENGVMIHVVPNRFWKALQFAMFVPNQLLQMAEILVSNERRKTIGKIQGPINNPRRRPAPFVVRNLWPQVHGESPNHLVEFIRMGASHWDRLFFEAGFHLTGQIDGLPAHSPYRIGLEAPRRVLEKMGLSSCNGYVLTKIGQPSPATRFFIADGLQ